MICHLTFSFIAYNITLNKLEKVKLYKCYTNKKEYTISIPKRRECGFNLIDGKKYWYCFIRRKDEF